MQTQLNTTRQGQLRHIFLGGGLGVLAGAVVTTVAAGVMVWAFTATQPTGAVTPAPHSALASLNLDPTTGKILLDDSWCTLFVGDADRDTISSNIASRMPDGLEIASIASVSNGGTDVLVADSSVTLNGRYGKLTVSPSGEYTFTLVNKDLAAGEAETFDLKLATTSGQMATIALHFTFGS